MPDSKEPTLPPNRDSGENADGMPPESSASPPESPGGAEAAPGPVTIAVGLTLLLGAGAAAIWFIGWDLAEVFLTGEGWGELGLKMSADAAGHAFPEGVAKTYQSVIHGGIGILQSKEGRLLMFPTLVVGLAVAAFMGLLARVSPKAMWGVAAMGLVLAGGLVHLLVNELGSSPLVSSLVVGVFAGVFLLSPPFVAGAGLPDKDGHEGASDTPQDPG